MSPDQGRAYAVRSQDIRNLSPQQKYVRMYVNSRSKVVTKSSRPNVRGCTQKRQRRVCFNLPDDDAMVQSVNTTSVRIVDDVAGKQSANVARNSSITLAPFTGKPKITIRLTITRSNLLFVPVRIGDGYLDMLIDTDARYTFMDRSMLEIISRKDPQFSTIQLQESEVGAIVFEWITSRNTRTV
jgi:hypothetical protein